MTTAQYADVEMSIAQMAEKWGVGDKTIENWTEGHISTRSGGDARF